MGSYGRNYEKMHGIKTIEEITEQTIEETFEETIEKTMKNNI